MIAWLKDLARPIRVSDPVFGEMRYVRSKRHWEGSATFGPAVRSIEVIVPGDEAGPSAQLREFFASVDQRYVSLLEAVQPLLEAHREDPSRETEFELAGVRLPRVPTADALWSLWYRSKPAGWFYAVEMRGSQPISVGEER